jgi:hypothetical protein
MRQDKKQPAPSSSPALAETPELILTFCYKFLQVAVVILFVIYLADLSDLFESDQKNDHTRKAWDSFYGFTSVFNVDVLLLGNSHMYTGVNPETLCTTLGVNGYLLAAPGTTVADSYYSLKEALKRCKPRLVVLETYGINNFDQHRLSPQALSEQINSFSARKNVLTKLESTPDLFCPASYPEAWSSTLRNHYYLYAQTNSIRENWEQTGRRFKVRNELYLGRYVRFFTGMEKKTLERYDHEGAPVDGNDYRLSADAELYVDKIVKLCARNHVELMFITLPMYYKNIRNYPAWKEKLGRLLHQYSNPWLDLQDPYAYTEFTPLCFENTYSKNQHMTYMGSIVATYKLAHFIATTVKPNLPNRKKEAKWITLFYGKDGYFENNSPHPRDKKVKVLCSNKVFQTVTVNELIGVIKNQKVVTLIGKIDRKQIGNPGPARLKLLVKYTNDQSRDMQKELILSLNPFQQVPDQAIFRLNIDPITITDVLDASFIR